MIFTSRWKPYLLIAIAGLLAYLPVSSMLFSLKNDVIAIEYPVQHFMGESLRNGHFPGWFNTWSMGFPLQSVLTWGVYSTPAMMTGLLTGSNIYVLQAEFVLVIIASGCMMYKLLKTHFISDQHLALLLSCCFMLSGFTVGSSQWLLYITGMLFIPFSVYCLAGLLKQPGWKYALLYAVSWFLLFTNVHIYLTVVTGYAQLIFLAIHFATLFFSKNADAGKRNRLLKFGVFSFLLSALLCAAPAYYTMEVVRYLERSLPLEGNSVFFQSNYLHPAALDSFLLPLSSIKTSHFNTEGTVLDVYLGLLPLLLFPLSVLINIRKQNKAAWHWLAVALLFLFISFGHLTPLRGWLNLFPGMSHFRHPGVLRVFFNMAFIMYLATSFCGITWYDLFRKGSAEKKWLGYSGLAILIILLLANPFFAKYAANLWKGSFYGTIKNISKQELTLISLWIQLFFITILGICLQKKQQWLSFILVAELVVNTLLCTPFFTISAYHTKEVASILQTTDGFPVQTATPSAVPATFFDAKGNAWQNSNTYTKEVSNDISMPGPLIMQRVAVFLSAGGHKELLKDKPLVFLKDSSGNMLSMITIVKQWPSRVETNISLAQPGEIVLQQAGFPGWKAYYNNQPVALEKNDWPFVSVKLPAGHGKLAFVFEKKGVQYSAISLHLFTLLVLTFYSIRHIRSAFPSSRY